MHISSILSLMQTFYHINYKALPYVIKVAKGLPDMNIDHEGNCKGCARGKNIKSPFLKSETKTKGTLELIHYDLCSLMPSIVKWI